ncbi:MAG: hypothetical protein IJM76_03115 [Lachnospiraceae bacterium]|nr:hypothetical protein [Lachnospiraceae bacterium]
MLRLPRVFSDHMMLQREKPVKIFGTSDAGKTVKACLLDAGGNITAEAGAAADKEGHFTAVLPALSAGLDKTLVLSDGDDTVTIRDVAVGEVWLAGGQSNMEYLMSTDAELKKERAGLAALPEEERRMFRFFDCPEYSFHGMEKLLPLPNFGRWRCLTEEDIVYFSAVSYYFERKIQPLLGCPVAVIGCNWGGSRAVCWLPEETVLKAGAGIWLEEYEDGLKAVRDPDAAAEAYKKTPMNVLSDPEDPTPFERVLFPGFSREMQEKAMTMMPAAEEGADVIGPLHPWRPCGLYETMLKTLMPYTLRGFLWYQGCSDETHPELYAKLLQTLIEKWRADFEDPALPFLEVQLAPFLSWLGCSGARYPEVRRAQEEAADITPDTWLASTGDAGMIYDIHPKHKRKPGERLGLLALRHVYGLSIAADAPRALDMTYDGDTAVIRFAHGEGLALTAPENGGLSAEEAAEAGFSDPAVPKPLGKEENLKALLKVFPEGTVDAGVDGGTLRIRLTVDGKAVKPERVEFAWTPYYEVNVKNAAGLPVFPFVLEAAAEE